MIPIEHTSYDEAERIRMLKGVHKKAKLKGVRTKAKTEGVMYQRLKLYCTIG